MKTKKTRSRVYGGIKANLRQAERRKKLIEAGLEAFGTKGYAKTNIKMICGIAGLTERYFYESFRHKEDLLRVVYRELIDEGQRDAMAALEDNEGTPVDAAARVLRMFYQRFRQDPRRAQIQLFEILGVSKNIDREYQNAMRLLADLEPGDCFRFADESGESFVVVADVDCGAGGAVQFVEAVTPPRLIRLACAGGAFRQVAAIGVRARFDDATVVQLGEFGHLAEPLQADAVRYDGGRFLAGLPPQETLLLEAGYYFGTARLQPFAQYARRDFVRSAAGDEKRLAAGCGWYFRGHEQNLKVSFARVEPAGGPRRDEIVLQWQLFAF